MWHIISRNISLWLYGSTDAVLVSAPASCEKHWLLRRQGQMRRSSDLHFLGLRVTAHLLSTPGCPFHVPRARLRLGRDSKIHR
ncbi:Protein of unknown function [Gryllus bimaculatus]|nr:Protein of unknown function [Gryllus bimaculatus]